MQLKILNLEIKTYLPYNPKGLGYHKSGFSAEVVESFEEVDISFLSIKVMKVCLIKYMGCMLWHEVEKVNVLRVLKMMENDCGACIYGALVSVNTNDIFSNNEFPILDVGRKIISKDNGERGFNLSSFMNEAISKIFEGAFGIVWSRPLVTDFDVGMLSKSDLVGNDESKKMQKYILKQQFEGFSVSNIEGLHKGYDRFQSLPEINRE
ncbi:hypothetical protein Tco_1097644 [Tanacetum coccineum]